MTADEIRKTELCQDWTEPWENFADSAFHMLQEIAAQLAELNKRLAETKDHSGAVRMVAV